MALRALRLIAVLATAEWRSMKIDELPNSVKDRLHQLCGALNLPDLYSFDSLETLIWEIQNRVSQAKSLIKQASINMGG